MTPSGTNLLGLVKHLAAVKYGWFCDTFGRQTEPLPFDDDDPDADRRVHGRTRRPRTSSPSTAGRARPTRPSTKAQIEGDRHRLVRRRGLDALVADPHDRVGQHAGHVDIIRELIDGMTRTGG